MKKVILIMIPLLFFSFSWDQKCLNNLMLGYKIRFKGKTLFKRLQKDPKFKMFTSEAEFKNKGEFTAKYLEKSKVYPYADSVYFNMSFGTDEGLTGVDKPKTLKVVTITEYFKDSKMILSELERLKVKICSSYKFERSAFINGEGFVELGVNSDPIPYPSLEIVPSTEKDQHPHLEILIIDLEK